MTKHLLHYMTISTFLIILSGCGNDGSSAVDDAGKTTNSFARNSDTADNEIIEGGTSSVTSCSSTQTSRVSYCLAVEATDTMIASWQSDLYKLITPSKAYAFRGLSTVKAQQVSVIQVDHNLAEISSSIIPPYTVKENTALGTYSISFDEAPPGRLDIVAKVTLENGQVLFAPFIALNVNINNSPEVIVNVVSDFQVKQLYSQLDTTEDLASLLPCTGSVDDIDCKNQPLAKQNNWAGLTYLIQNYEIDIPATMNIPEALVLLDGTAEFKNHIQTSINEIIRAQEPFVGGTEREFDLLDENIDKSKVLITKAYNSSLFTLAFNQLSPEATSSDASISTSISTSFENIYDGISVFTYPELTESVSNFNLSIATLAGTLPFERRSLIQKASGEVNLSPIQENSLTAAPGNSYLTRQGFYLTGKTPFQTITGKNETETSATGWQFDPYMHLLYKPAADGGKPNSLLSSFVSNGSSIFITREAGASWDRKTKLEEQNLFSWTIHNETSENFSATAIDGKEYGVINFSVKLNDDDIILKTIGSINKWNASALSLSESQPGDIIGGDNHYQSYSFTRDGDQSLDVSLINSPSGSRLYQAISTTKSVPVSLANPNGIETKNVGRLKVSSLAGDLNSNASFASSTPDGGMLTVTLNEEGAGQGIIQAIEMRLSDPVFPSGTPITYRLSGNSLGADGSLNYLRNYTDSTITITGSSVAITLNAIESTHDVNTQNVSDLKKLIKITDLNGSYAVDKGLIELSFPDNNIKFKGFISKPIDGIADAPGNLMTLLMIQNYEPGDPQATIGFIHAFKEQSLPVWEE